VPPDNPLTEEKIALGKLLFFDPQLSADGSLACVSCHLPDQGWATATPLSPAYPSNKERRNSPTLLNVAYNNLLLWDGRAKDLEKLSLVPIQNPLHMNHNLYFLIEKLNEVPDYVERFQKVFGTRVTGEGIGKALGAFQRTLVTQDSPFDRYLKGDQQALSEAAMRGLALFQGKARCALCHNGPTFADGNFYNLGVPSPPYMNDPKVQATIRFDVQRMRAGEYRNAKEDLGRFLVTKKEQDKGLFRTPTLRHVTQTAPYMHNGALATLAEVIDFYDQGGGDMAEKSPLMQPLGLTPQEKADLLAFLQALTGELPNIATPTPPQIPAGGSAQ
jgi:cytochrome c peroxidase